MCLHSVEPFLNILLQLFFRPLTRQFDIEHRRQISTIEFHGTDKKVRLLQGIRTWSEEMVGPTNKAMATCLFEVVFESIVTMISSLGGFHKNKVKRKIRFSVLFQLLPVDVPLIMGDIDAMHLIATRDTNAILLPSVALLPTIRIRADNEIIESERKYPDHNKRKGIAHPNGHGAGSFLFRFRLPCRCTTTGSGFAGGRSVS